MFGGKKNYNPMKLKTNLKLAVTRLQMLEKKHDNASIVARKEVANLLGNNRVELAKIKVEQVIRDDFYREALEILETYCSLALTRFGLIESVSYCDPGIRKAVCTIMWATPRVSVDVVEFKEISKQLSLRYGKEFADGARSNTGKEVCPRVMQKLNFVMPDTGLVIGYLEAIASKYKVDWQPKPSDFDPMPDSGPYNNNGGGGGGGNGGLQQPLEQKPVDLMTQDIGSLELNFPQPPQTTHQQQQQQPAQAAYAFPPPLSTTPSYPPQQQRKAADESMLAFPPAPQQQQPSSYPPQRQQQQPPQQQQQQSHHASLMDLPSVPDAQPPSYGTASAPSNGDSFDPFVSAFPTVPGGAQQQQHNTTSDSLIDLPPPPSTSSNNNNNNAPLDYDSLTARFNALQSRK